MNTNQNTAQSSPSTYRAAKDFSSPRGGDRCAWYLRVSTPRQKLEHQRESVIRFCDDLNLIVPENMRFEDKEKRHKSAKRQEFQRLLSQVRAGALDWIIICTFDRWGVADVEEFFEFRQILRKNDVQLWSVVDGSNLTGIDEGDYYRVVSMAIGASKYVESMAEKNVLKMIEMAKQGWAATGNAAFAIDLVCYPLHDLTRPLFRVVRMRYMRPHLYRVIYYTPESRVERDASGLIVGSNLTVEREEITERMPLRDKKATGYRFEPSIEIDRLRTVQLLYEMYDSGMGFAQMSHSLHAQGMQRYDKPFVSHAIETILSNPVYLGEPAWGKIGVGAYRILHNGQPIKVRRKAKDPFVLRKDESQHIRPLRPAFAPIVAPDLWRRVHDRLAGRAHTNPDFGKRRTRDRTSHPLNGKLICPECRVPMVLGSSIAAKGKRRKSTRCFNCGTYRKSGRLQCHSNAVPFDLLNQAIAQLLGTVAKRIDNLVDNPLKTLKEAEWIKECELTAAFQQIQRELSKGLDNNLIENEQCPDADVPIFQQVLATYNRLHAHKTRHLQKERDQLETEIKRLGDLIIARVPSQIVMKMLYDEVAKLEKRKREMEEVMVPATAKAAMVLDQLRAIRKSAANADQAAVGRLLDQFVESVVPHFDVQQVGPNKTRRAHLKSVEFVPQKTQIARNILPDVMEISAAHKGTDSSKRRARSSRGTSSR